MAKLLITGRSGMIGSNVANYFANKHTIFSLGRSDLKQKHVGVHYSGCDITDPECVQQVIDKVDPDIVLHFAANPLVRFDTSKPNDTLITNVIGTNTLLNALKPKTRVIFASSIVVYDYTHASFHAEYDRIKAKSIYGASKIACEALFPVYQEYKNINYTIVRLGATIGNNLTHGLIFDILRKLKENPQLELLGDKPGSIKPYTHITDVLSGLELILERGPQIVNLCVNDPISVETVAQTVMNTIGVQKEITWNPANWVGDNPRLHASTRLIESYGWKPAYSSVTAIERTIHDFISNQTGSLSHS